MNYLDGAILQTSLSIFVHSVISISPPTSIDEFNRFRNYKKSKDKVNHYFRIDARPAKTNCLFEKSVYEIQESIKKTR
jgi:hypothetical protein